MPAPQFLPVDEAATPAAFSVLSLGGSFLDDRTFVAPCVFSRWA